MGLIRFNCFKELYKNSFYPSNLISNAAYLMTPSQPGYSSPSAPGVSESMHILFRSLPFILFCRKYFFYCLSRNPEEQEDTKKKKILFLFFLFEKSCNYTRLVLNSLSSCLSLPNTGIADVCHHSVMILKLY